MSLHGAALRLTIVVGESDRWHHHPLFTEIVYRAHRAGLAGATVVRGIESFGAKSQVHTVRLLSLSEDLPVVITIVDTEDRIKAFLRELDELELAGLVTLEPVEVIRYTGPTSEPQGRPGPDPGR